MEVGGGRCFRCSEKQGRGVGRYGGRGGLGRSDGIEWVFEAVTGGI